MKTFAELGLSDKLLKAVADKGYDTPSPIQAKAIPAVLKGGDLLAAAQTGTGKTAGFTLPMMQRLYESGHGSGKRRIRCLVLTPTRELAAQILESVQDYGKYLPLKSTVVFGGVNIRPQMSTLRHGVDILVATPGRLLDLCQQGACSLDSVEILVLDEADRMLDMGFINDIRKVIKMVPADRQTLLFSATFSREIRNITRDFLTDPQLVEVSPENTAAETVKQRAFRCDASDKPDIAVKLIKDGNWEQVLVFTRTKHGANRLAKKLDSSGIVSSAIHGNKSQAARTKALAGFKAGKVRVLVATDIAARGLDIVQLPHVINYELPNVSEDYVHRIGRTGRAGQEGEAVSLVSNDERPFMSGIEKLIGQRIQLEVIDGFAPNLWPDRAPTEKEVQKKANDRRESARQNRGPRRGSPGGGNGRPGQGGKSSGGGSRSGGGARSGGGGGRRTQGRRSSGGSGGR